MGPFFIQSLFSLFLVVCIWIRNQTPDPQHWFFVYRMFLTLCMMQYLQAVCRIHIILIRIRIQDVKKFVTDPDPG